MRTVVHLAGAIRDQPHGSIEELNGIATWRHGRRPPSARASSASCSSRALGATPHHRTRFLRAKALAEQAVREAATCAHDLRAVASSTRPATRYLTLLERLALLPVMPRQRPRAARSIQPIWAEDVADCVWRALGSAGADADERYELAGPETLTPPARSCELALRAARPPPAHSCTCPTPIVCARTLRARRGAAESKALATWDEAELMEVSMLTARGTADAEALGVAPAAMAAVLGARLGVAAVARAGRAHGSAASSCAASASSVPSPAGCPMSWTPTGRPSSRWYSGSEIAG